MRRNRIVAAIESGTMRNELKRLNEQIDQLTQNFAGVIAEVISSPQFRMN